MFDQYIGRHYDDVMHDMRSEALEHGWKCFSWPEGIGGVSSTDDAVVVYINNDIDQIITRIQIPEVK